MFNQAVTYVCSVAYMYALIVLLGGVSLPNVTTVYQVLAENSRPIAGSEKRPAFAIVPRLHRVGVVLLL